jgi:hypothetical protein
MSRRRLLLAVMVAVLPWAVVAATVDAQPPPVKAPSLSASVSTCTTGLAAADRAAVFTGSMPAGRRGGSMAMRFDLYEREGQSGPFRRLAVPNFGVWERSERNVAGFLYDKRVELLQAPAAYRVTVRFRWYDAKGKVVRRATRTSPACVQSDLRADLGITRLTIGEPRADGTALYSATVRNAGATPVDGEFLVGLTLAGNAQPPRALAALDAGGSATLTFVAPACAPGTPVVATADVAKAVEEADERDNTARKTCPGA